MGQSDDFWRAGGRPRRESQRANKSRALGLPVAVADNNTYTQPLWLWLMAMATSAPLLLDAGRVSAAARDFWRSSLLSLAQRWGECTGGQDSQSESQVRRWPACLKPSSLHCESPLSGTARTIGRSGDRPPSQGSQRNGGWALGHTRKNARRRCDTLGRPTDQS